MPVQTVINNFVKLDSHIESRVNSAENHILDFYEKHQFTTNGILLLIAFAVVLFI